MDNPYLDEFMANELHEFPYDRPAYKPGTTAWEKYSRNRYTRKYAWAVPTEEAIDLIGRYAPIVEIGAGTGYWAWLMRQKGIEVEAFDLYPPAPDGEENHYHKGSKTWTEVKRSGPRVLKRFPWRTLFLCWPPYSDSMALRCLRLYQGRWVIYVGESYGGCTGDDEFHSELERKWEAIDSLELPQWWGIHDDLTVWRRKD